MTRWWWPVVIFVVLCRPLQAVENAQDGWHQWRGPLATGVSPTAQPPVRWSESENVRWKVTLPGSGHSTPIVWKEYLYLTAAIPFGDKVKPAKDIAPGAHDNLPVIQRHRFVVLAVRRKDGEIAWQTVLREELPHEGGHVTGSLASNSVITDGKRLYVSLGSRGVHALDLTGRIVWQRDFGQMMSRHAHGEGSSAAVHGDKVVVNFDNEGQSFIVALNAKTGETVWKTDRDEPTSWSTPLITKVDGRPQVVVSATKRIRGYDLESGKAIWECSGLSRNVVASPVAADGIVYLSNSYDWQILMAIRMSGARGDISGTEHVLWSVNRYTSYVPSPLLYQGSLYVIGHNQGLMTRLNAKTGKVQEGPFRLKEINNVFASPMAANGRIYICDRDGTTIVLDAGRETVTRAINQLDDRFAASPVAAGRDLYLRGHRYLYCISSGK